MTRGVCFSGDKYTPLFDFAAMYWALGGELKSTDELRNVVIDTIVGGKPPCPPWRNMVARQRHSPFGK